MHLGAEPEDMVGIVLYLCSDAASYVTGQTFVVDGGQMVRGFVPLENTIYAPTSKLSETAS